MSRIVETAPSQEKLRYFFFSGFSAPSAPSSPSASFLPFLMTSGSAGLAVFCGPALRGVRFCDLERYNVRENAFRFSKQLHLGCGDRNVTGAELAIHRQAADV